MSNSFLAAAASTSAERTSFSWLSLTRSAVKIFAALLRTVGTWRSRRRQRRELFEFLASDHRAAADIGITRYDAEHWFDWPFRS
jgi:uncharacterized protein YjiS (DUF1127 family)